MSKNQSQYPILPPLQKRIVLNLAHKGPQTINQTAKNLKSQYKATYIAFESLENKKIIKNVGKKEYRNRNYPLFWLTDEGLILALIHNANPDILKVNAVQVYGENEAYSLMSDLAKALPIGRLAEIYTLFKTTEEGKPKLKAIPITSAETQVFFKTLMQYPSFQTQVKKALKGIEKMFEEVLDYE